MRLGRWKYTLIALPGLFAVLLVVTALTVPLSSDALRHRFVDTLAARLDSTVELADFHARLFPTLHVEGSGLTIRHRGRTDVPPLISVDSFAVDTGLIPLIRRHVTGVKLVGLKIQIPPGEDERNDERPDDSKAESPEGRKAEGQEGRKAERQKGGGVVVDRLDTRDASLVIIPGKPGVRPKVWSIHTLAMRDVGADTPMPFEATLTNAVPPGEIATSGSFGPWAAADPGETPLNGAFRFDNANLAVFGGVYGTLSAHGSFGGSLGRIDVNGETNTPDFGLTTAAHSVPLHATYHSIVDGTNGDTLLERIDASFLDTALTASGAVLENPGEHGRTVSLDVTIDKGRLEDILRLAVKTTNPPMTGALRLSTTFELPPGSQDVVDRLRLTGRFSIDGARFTSLDIQRKINELSHRSRGRKADLQPARVLSDFNGQFRLKSAALTLPAVQFAVPGAAVRLSGDYGIRSEKLDFRGRLQMAAKVSETVSGFKHLLLKVVDPLFSRKGGGSEVPIRISGTRNAPSFGLDKGRIFRR